LPQVHQVVDRIHRAFFSRTRDADHGQREKTALDGACQLLPQIEHVHAEQAVDIHQDDVFAADSQ
jgi:hypothetical protein